MSTHLVVFIVLNVLLTFGIFMTANNTANNRLKGGIIVLLLTASTVICAGNYGFQMAKGTLLDKTYLQKNVFYTTQFVAEDSNSNTKVAKINDRFYEFSVEDKIPATFQVEDNDGEITIIPNL